MAQRVALVFPGQGSQRIGMLEDVPENEALDRLFDAAEALSGLPLCAAATDGPDEKLADTRFAQPLLYLADWAWGVALLESGVEPHSVAGHSLGEFAALAVAGVFSVEAGLELVIERSKLMSSVARQNPGAMAAVLGMDGGEIASVVTGIDGVWVANDNAPGQVVISGDADGVARASEALTEAGARRIVPLKVAGAFHSPLMETARARFADILSATEFSDAYFPVHQNTGPDAVTEGALIRERLMRQITEPVRWTEVMRSMVDSGITVVVEAGPGNVLSGLTRRVEGLTGVSAEAVGMEQVLEEVS